MFRLSPRQIQALTKCVCGEDPDAPFFAYRRWVDLDAFMRFAAVETDGVDQGSYSRQGWVAAVIEEAQRAGEKGASGLSVEIEELLVALLDVREFDSEDERDEGLLRVNEILRGVPAEARVARHGAVQVVSTEQTRAQRVLDEQIHTVFGETLTANDLMPSRVHYAKARRFLSASDRDFENAAKEAVASLESLVVTLTAEGDYTKAVRKATKAGLIPRPIDDVAMKLYAYRGNEPGVAHGGRDVPDVTEEEAQLVLNLVGALGAYLAERLRAT